MPCCEAPRHERIDPAVARPTIALWLPNRARLVWLVFLALLAPWCCRLSFGQDCPGGYCPITVVPRHAAPAARPTPSADYQRAVVRVGRDDLASPGASYSGAGTYVAQTAGRGLVLTASHVVEQGGGRIWVDFGRGRQTASLLGRDSSLDLAALTVDHPPEDVPAIPLANDDEWPQAGDNVEVIGFGGGRLRHFAAPVRGYTTKNVPDISQLVVAFEPVSGDSGGAILFSPPPKDASAASAVGDRPRPRDVTSPSVKLAGILWGGPCAGPQQPAYETHATCCIYIRRFLERIGVRLSPRRPSAEQAPGATGPNNASPNAVPPAGAPAPPAAPSADATRLAALEKRLDDLAASVSSIASVPAGAAGPRGPQGLPGPAGPAGKEADPAALAALASRVTALEKSLKGRLRFTLQVDPHTGKILSTSSGSQ
ncbi:MAG TPA: serine protease [Pirellulales bacterium]|nr:serine protease [Pirellulales bacterium]